MITRRSHEERSTLTRCGLANVMDSVLLCKRLTSSNILRGRAAWGRVLALMLLMVVIALPARAADDEKANEYRLTLFPYHRHNDKLTGFGYLGYVNNPDNDYVTGYLGYGLFYSFNPTVQTWGGLITTFTDNSIKSDKFELRPFVGLKLFVPNRIKWHIYSFTRYEYRAIQDRNTDDWTEYYRLRNRFGVEFPLASQERAWQQKSLFGLFDVEPFYRSDVEEIDPFRIRGGLGYFMSSRITLELSYSAQFTRPTGDDLEFTDNILRLNVKIALQKGVMSKVFGGDAGD